MKNILKDLRLGLLMLGAACALSTSAKVYFEEDFSNGMPTTFTLIDGDEYGMQQGIYKDLEVMANPWFVERLGDGYYNAAMSATRNLYPDLPSENWMKLPPIELDDDVAFFWWESRSLHEAIGESYRLVGHNMVSQEWVELYSTENEPHAWTRHVVSLEQFKRKHVVLAFVATSMNGFILAVDNIRVATADDIDLQVDMLTPHFLGSDDKEVCFNIRNFGKELPAGTKLQLSANGEETESVNLTETLATGESVKQTFAVSPALDEYTALTLTVNDGEYVYDNYVCASNYRRTSFVDRCSGTWCNVCPPMGLGVERLKAEYGDQVIVVEAHVNDALTDQNYWDNFLSEFVFNIPLMEANHITSKIIYDYNKDLFPTDPDEIAAYFATPAGIKAEYELNGGDMAITTTAEFAMAVDNSAGRYRIGYMLVGTCHDEKNSGYIQSNSPTNYKVNQYWYQPAHIAPEMMYYENVVLESTTAITGIEGSLPGEILAATPCEHTYSYTLPTDKSISHVRAVAMIIDNEDGHIVNCAYATLKDEPEALDTIGVEPSDETPEYYDLTGRRVLNPGAGIFIRKTSTGATKIMKH
ncbi:MAG: hypothetical protein HUK13_05715 [Muribaculaceae bacterium]|mgnify:CR=1 FL=1|nr:hypothetical protein [Muribaculaceae bacterium]